MADIAGIPILWGLEAVFNSLECSDAVFDYGIPAANAWIQIAGRHLYEQSGDDMTGHGTRQDLWEPGGKSEGGWVGFGACPLSLVSMKRYLKAKQRNEYGKFESGHLH